ncbi:hypothetical protein CLV28_1673 [Sediminihabitans luteus]|uniref:Uncharacterized protein n=1 Tax=Sediminihabitans luteus TaxID=1138585 RepID=A0A2M9CQL0_9CELL|nr:DUF6167 family protein [Sediminihabitans luteus]PJJ74179.1 hypothetical protein CLV28_1673 [Sediminihabitans luteus]GII99032.1 hypothetical protein Slu03_14100 [Sediminihabitans luteus]
MRRLVWVGVGVGLTVVVVVQGRRLVARYAPEALVERAADSVDAAGARGLEFVRVFRDEFSRARAAREVELRAALLAEGQPHPDEVRAARRRAREQGPADDVPDDEELLGYSFF